MGLFKSNKCQSCKARVQQRYCMRSGKEICWECCNKQRYDYKCPSECRYSLKEQEGLPSSATNIDSQTEYRDLMRRLVDRWMLLPQAELDGAIPIELSRTEDGKSILKEYFNRYKVSMIPEINYITDKLHISGLDIAKATLTFEEIASKYLKLLLVKDYQGSLNLHYSQDRIEKDEKWKEDYIEQLQSDNVIKKLNDLKLVSSAMSEDRKQAVVYFSINRKYDLTVKWIESEGWKVWQRIMGKMEIVNSENEAIKQVAVLISKNQLGQACELLDKYLALYPDSADFQYYKGVYEQLHKRFDKAKSYLIRAIRLDPEFKDAVFNYGYLIHQEGDLDEALRIYKHADELDGMDIRIKNNIAAIYIDREEYILADTILQKCQEIDAKYEPALRNIERLKEIKANL